MKIKTIQWNIGGGKIRKAGSDASKDESYSIDGLSYIINILKKNQADIITLQEIHSKRGYNQAKIIAKKLGFKYFYNDTYDNSHIEMGQKLCQAIISRFPLSQHKFELFYNPKYKIVQASGKLWVTHDKGISSCMINIQGQKLFLQTLHLFPFKRFEVPSIGEQTKKVRLSVTQKIMSKHPLYLLQGDFNFNNQSLKKFLPDIFVDNLKEILQKESTTPKGRKYDHILYKGLKLKKSKVIKRVLTDHLPIYTEFEM